MEGKLIGLTALFAAGFGNQCLGQLGGFLLRDEPTGNLAAEDSKDDGYVVHFYVTPFMYWDWGSPQFMAQGVEGLDMPPLAQGEAPEPDLGWAVGRVSFSCRSDWVNWKASVRGIREARRPPSIPIRGGLLLCVLYEMPTH
jgi:hypothetical protein